MKRFFILTFSLCLVGGTLFATGSSQAGSPSSGVTGEFTATYIRGSYGGDPNEMILYKALEQDTKVKVNWVIIPETIWPERKNILINSGDMPDVFYMNTYTNVELDRYGRQGLFLDLTNHIKQFAPNLQKILGEYPVFKAAITNPADGKIYSVRGMNNRLPSGTTGQMFLYQPWLDKLGLKMPTTYLEFEEVLRAFKTRDPNGNGRADEFPYVFGNGWSGNSSLQQLFAMFGYGYQGTRSGIDSFVEDMNGRAVFVPGTENYKEAIIWLHKLFSEGLFAEEDYAAMDNSLLLAKTFSDVVVAGGFGAFHKTSAYAPAERFNDYVRISVPMKGPHGEQIYVRNNKIMGLTGGGLIITQKAERKVPDIMRWLDAHFETRRSIQMALGPIGVTLEEKPSGIIGYKPTPADTTYNQFRYGNCPVDAPFFIAPQSWGSIIDFMEEDIDRIPWVQNDLAPYFTQYFIYSYPVANETTFIQGRGQEIENYVKTTQAKWLMQGGIESEWNAFQARLRDMGVEEYTRIMQNQIDRFVQYSK
ncbi:MAG: extracellular solute-binding protein [Treponema sp.]|nr:extracellular solute-binding protein [Treponema sp.]